MSALTKERQKMETTQKNNVVFFPKEKRISPVQNFDELYDIINEAKKATADIIIEDVITSLFSNFSKFNVTVKEKNSDLFMKDVALIAEAIKSGVFRSFEFEHPLHNVSSNMFEQVGENEIRLKLDNFIIKEDEEKVEDGE
jgi:hypothetical protein